MLTITNILNPLTGGSTITEYPWGSGKSLAEYIGYEGACLVRYDEGAEEIDSTTLFPADGDTLTFMPLPEGGDKQTWRVLGYAAMTGVSFIPGWGPIAAWVGGNIIRSFLQDKEKTIDTSASYSWQHRSSDTAAHGAAMPIIYGKARVRPVLKNRYVTVSGDKQRLYALYSLACHKVDRKDIPVIDTLDEIPLAGWQGGSEFEWSETPGLTYIYNSNPTIPFAEYKYGHGTGKFADHVIVNGRSIDDYNKDVEWETRPGLPEQTVIEGFDVTYSNTAVDELLYLDYPEISRTDTIFVLDSDDMLVAWVEHNLTYHGAIYTIKAGSLKLTSAMIGETVYILLDTAISYTEYQTTWGSPTFPSTAYPVFTFTVTASGWTDKAYPSTTNLPVGADWISPVSRFTNAHNIELMFEFPYGLYGTSSEGKSIPASCRLFAQYRVAGGDDDAWTNFDFAFHKMLGIFWRSGTDYVKEYPDSNIISGNISRNKPRPFAISLRARREGSPLDYDETYEVRVSAASTGIVMLTNIAKVTYGAENNDGLSPGFTYPGEPLLGIKALASGQISGDLDVQVDVERGKVWVKDGTNLYPLHPGWNRLDANNHAWAVYDILAQGHINHPAYPSVNNVDAEAMYGCGIDADRIDYDSFEVWANYIDNDLGYELDIVFDTFMPAWDAILRICQEGCGMIHPVGTKIYAFADMPGDVTQVFTMGNIVADTFTQKYMEGIGKANMIEVTFYDADKNYGKTVIAARTSDWDSSTDLNTPLSVTLYGTTSFNQAYSLARYILRGNELLNNAISFGVDVDSLAAQVGDVVAVSHDVLGLGLSGRVVSATDHASPPHTVTLDRIVTSVAGYTLTVRHPDGTVETHATTTNGSTDTLEFEFPWDTAPAQYDPYSFGEGTSNTRKYRVAKISRTDNLMRTLTLVQYDADLYTGYTPADTPPAVDDGQVVAVGKIIPSTTVEKAVDLLNFATNLQLLEVTMQNRTTGEYESRIVATWESTSGDPRGQWEVWFRDVDASDVSWQGAWLEDYEYGYGDKVVMVDGKTYISIADENTAQPFS